ncbi:MAG: N4-gp56 family major capsid protein, partial [Clostridia bacterium]|nr:N4-gp56 family major capsid protein [Clostridia bacterium]
MMKHYILMDLQLFADPNGYYAGTSTMSQTSNIGSETTIDGGVEANALTIEMKTVYDRHLIEKIGPNLVHAQFGDPAPIGGRHGNEIEWREFGKFAKALTPLTEGVTPVASTLTVARKTKKVEQFGDYSIITDILDLCSIDPTLVEYTRRHAQNASLTLDTIVRNELVSGTNVIYAAQVNGSTVTPVEDRDELSDKCLLTVDTVSKASTWLRKRNAPKIDGSYVAIVHPSISYDLQRQSEFIDVAKYADATRIFNGEIGKLYGVRFVESTEAKVFKECPLADNSGTDVYELTVSSASSKTASVTGGTLTANALAGRKLRVIKTKVADSTTADEVLTVASNTTDS